MSDMQTFIVYLVKMTICSGILLLYFFLFLRHQRFHRYNRFFLLSAMVASLLLPLIKISLPVAGSPQLIPYFDRLADITITPHSHAGKSDSRGWIIAFYALVSAGFLTSLLVSFYKIQILKRNSHSKNTGPVRVYETINANTPFTFMNYIFWDSDRHGRPQNDNVIFRHEWYHAINRHSIDIVVVELTRALFWINPFFYFLRRELSSVHEFEADEYAVGAQDKESYARLLISDAINRKSSIQIAHHFFYSPFKQRLMMLVSQTKKTRLTSLRKLMAMPLAAILLCVAAFSNAQPTPDPQPHPHPRTDPLPGVSVVAQSSPYGDATYPGGYKAWQQYLLKTLKYPQEAQDREIQGTVLLQFNVSSAGVVSNIKATSFENTAVLRNEAIRVIKNSGNWTPAKEDGKPVASVKEQPIMFRLERQ